MTKPNFKQFDIVSDHSDHHYRNEEKQTKGKKDKSEDGDCFINSDSTLYKAIMREWKILENGLPDTIYVRAYEPRVDLMRAAIVGAAGTPYHDALFVFDIKFPPDYPNRPPLVHYWSHGLCPNPCLWANGRVWMSLLNTVLIAGWGMGWWVPSQSTILQVLVSIQTLVLNDKPFFNEIDCKFVDKFFSMDTSIPYNIDFYMETCKSTVYLLRHPPKNFEGIISEHYRSKAGDILRAYIAYANGRVEVGHYNNEIEVPAEYIPQYDIYLGMKRRMDELYPVLVQAFKINGFSAEDWVEQDLFSEEIYMEVEPFPRFVRRVFSQCLPCLPWAAGNDVDDRDQPLLAIKKAS